MFTLILKLLVTFVPVIGSIIKARNDFVVANKRTSAKKKAALKSSYQTAVIGGLISLFIGFCLFASEVFDKQGKERAEVERHQDIRTNLLTTPQIAEIVRSELRATALSQEKIHAKDLRKRYPDGYALFSVTETYISEEMERWDKNYIRGDWQTAAVSAFTKDSVSFTCPNMIISGVTLLGAKVTLRRESGAKAKIIAPTLGKDLVNRYVTNMLVSAEVVTNTPIGVTMAIGLRRVITGTNGVVN